MEQGVNNLSVTIHAGGPASPDVALCTAIGLAGGDNAPDWVHLLPAGTIRTADGRGPYRYADAARLIGNSLAADERLVIDENHSTDLAAPKGLPAPAVGWVVELQARADGIWGKVEWTEDGRRLVSSRAYRGLSPVIAHDKAGNIDALLRASLVNKPNLRGLKTLHQETTDMNLLDKLLAALGLPADTSEATLLTAVTTLHAQQVGAKDQHKIALQAAIDPIAEATGLAKGATGEAILSAIATLKGAGDQGATIVALQAELKTVGETLTALRATGQRQTAEAFVDKAILDGRVGVKPLREHYITRHMADAAAVEKELAGLPALGGTILTATSVKVGEATVSLNAEQANVAALLGIPAETYAATLAAEQKAL